MKALKFVSGSVNLMRHHKQTFWLIAIPIFVLSFANTYLGQVFTQRYFPELSRYEMNILGMYYCYVLVSVIMSAIIGSAFAVFWHRRIILNEKVHYSLSNITRAPVWSYLGGMLTIAMIAFGTYVLFIVFAGTVLRILAAVLGHGAIMGIAAFVFFVFVFVFFLWLAVLFHRMAIILPSRAVGQSKSLNDALTATQDHFWFFFRLMFLSVIVTMALLAPAYLNDYAQFAGAQITKTVIANEISHVVPIWKTLYTSAVTPIITILQIGIISLLYSHFLHKE